MFYLCLELNNSINNISINLQEQEILTGKTHMVVINTKPAFANLLYKLHIDIHKLVTMIHQQSNNKNNTNNKEGYIKRRAITRKWRTCIDKFLLNKRFSSIDDAWRGINKYQSMRRLVGQWHFHLQLLKCNSVPKIYV